MIAPAASGKSFSRTPAWRFCYWGGIAALFAFAAWQRFSLPLDPIADPDTWGYLSPALGKLTGAEFDHTNGRNFIYPGLVFLLLRVFGDFRAITIAQHLLGLLAGGIFLLTWRRVRVFVPSPRIGWAAFDALGFVAAAIYLLASDPTRFEMQLRPEGVCAFLIGINLYAVVQYVAFAFLEKWPKAAVGFGITVVFTSILLASVKPSFWLIAIVDLALVAVFFFSSGGWRQKITLAAGALVSAALLLIPEHFLSRSDEASRTFLPTTLFVVHADLIRDQMAEDLERRANVPYSREWLLRVHEALRDEIAKSHAARERHYSSLGFDPDYLMHNENSIVVQLQREFGDDADRICAFYFFYYVRTWQQRPLAALKKVARQMARFYRPVSPVYNRRKSWPLTDVYERAKISLDIEPCRRIWEKSPAAVEFMRRTETLSQRAPTVKQPKAIRALLALPAITYLPLFLAALVLASIVLLQAEWRKRLGWLGALVLLAYSFNLAACLEVAVINSLQVGRYITVQLPFAIFAQFLALWFVLEYVFEKRAGKRSSGR
jgi:hypothetical protein